MKTDADRKDELKPDFEGFVRALRDDANWKEVINASPNDAQERTDSDAVALRRLASKAERLGIRQGYLKDPRHTEEK